MPTPDELNARFAISDVAVFETARGGLVRLNVTAPAAQGHVYLHGAHVTHYQPAGVGPLLFLSQKSFFATGKAIRGGVPVIFPWFGPRAGDTANMHGFVRTREWSVREVTRAGDDGVRATFGLASNDQTRAIWPHDFELTYAVTFGRALEMELAVKNTSPQPIRFEEALHTYLALGDVRAAALDGLGSATFVEKNRGPERQTQPDAILKLAGPTDRVYLGTAATCVVDDRVNRRRITIAKERSQTTVVWNPWSDKVVSIADLDAQEWTHFLCVETCNVWDHAVGLDPGATHVLRAVVSAEAQ